MTLMSKLYTYEPFGLARFATDHSETKTALRSLFVRLICLHQIERQQSLITPYSQWKQVNATILRLDYFS